MKAFHGPPARSTMCQDSILRRVRERIIRHGFFREYGSEPDSVCIQEHTPCISGEFFRKPKLMSNVALIPLRGGSKSIPQKNIKSLAGRPLCAWVLEAAAGCADFSGIYVSTDSDVIADVVADLGLDVQIIMRPAEYATDEASTEVVMLHAMSKIDFEVLVTIQATSPQLISSDLDLALSQFREQELDSMLSATRTRRFFWNDDFTPINYDPSHRPRRQDFPGTYMENGAFYITTRHILQDKGCRLGGKIGIYAMAESSAIEIDDPDDWSRVERILLDRQAGVRPPTSHL